jgi:hypothetical protein
LPSCPLSFNAVLVVASFEGNACPANP